MIVSAKNWREHQKHLGGKAKNLFLLQEQGVQIPSFFCLDSRAFQSHISRLSNFRELLESIDDSSPQKLAETSDQLRKAIVETNFDAEIASKLDQQLSTQFQPRTFFAIRSSAAGEDSVEQSFAGQMDTFLFCLGIDEVILSVKKCWASLFTERALTYRKMAGISSESCEIAVVIQEMIEGDVSGVAFSVNPVSQKANEILINSTFGLGEGIVSGELNTDQFVISRVSGDLLSFEVVEKEEKIVFDREKGRGIRKAQIIGSQTKEASLDRTQLEKLRQQILKIEEYYACPQDIEWTIRGAQLHILQSRPITSLDDNINQSKAAVRELEAYETIWDNSNIVESYSGVTTPLTYSFANHCYYMVYVQFCEVLKVPRDRIQALEFNFRNMLGLIHGRIYYNLKNWYRLVSVLPGYKYNAQFMEQMMGVKDQNKISTLGDAQKISAFKKYFVELPRLVLVGFNLFFQFVSLDRQVKKFTRIYSAIYEKYRNHDFTEQSLHKDVEAYYEMEAKVLRNWKAPIINDFMAMIFYGLLQKIIVKWGLDESGSLQNELLSDQGDVESTLPILKLQEIAVEIRGTSALLDLFRTKPADELCEKILSGSGLSKSELNLKGQIESYLDEFGFRAMNELKLEEPSLKENPEFVFSILKNYVSGPEPKRDVVHQNQAKEAYKKAKLYFGKSWKFQVFRLVLHCAKKAVRVREYQRFARTKMFGIMRNLFKAMGFKFAELRLIDHKDDIFYLTKDEIFAYVSGASVTFNIKQLVKQRKIEFEGYRAEDELPDRFVTRGLVYWNKIEAAEPEFDPDRKNLKGTSCCPGVVKGRVKVILSPSDDMSLDSEILVAGRTDPGWVTLYPSAIGLIIERGSVLSHSAIVARELGLPAIVGVPGATKVLETGDWVEMDGASGIITKLEKAQTDSLDGEHIGDSGPNREHARTI